MTISELKSRLNEEMEWAKELFSDIDGIEFSAHVEGAEDSSYTFGVVMIGAPGMSDEERIYVSLEADIDQDDNVDGEDFVDQAESFRIGLSDIAAALRASEDKAATLSEIGKSIDEKLDEAYAEELAKIDRESSERLKIAVGATIAILLLAAGCILIKILPNLIAG